MTYEYFSDKENGSRELNSEEIPLTVWKAVLSIYDKFVKNCALAGEFPIECPDSSAIYSCNTSQLQNILKGEIPELSLLSHYNYDEDNFPNKYIILDFLEFLYRHIKDPKEIRYHDCYNHQHYSFSDEGLFKSKFREQINSIFGRNGIVFFLNDEGKIKRSIPKSMAKIITDIRFETSDKDLNEMLEIAYSKFILPHIESRVESLEKIWDAFERLKTHFGKNKQTSADELIGIVSEKNVPFNKIITTEFKELTEIGNKFQIRHFEYNKDKLESSSHIDYLFYRMSCLIHLCVESLEKGNSNE